MWTSKKLRSIRDSIAAIEDVLDLRNKKLRELQDKVLELENTISELRHKFTALEKLLVTKDTKMQEYLDHFILGSKIVPHRQQQFRSNQSDVTYPLPANTDKRYTEIRTNDNLNGPVGKLP